LYRGTKADSIDDAIAVVNADTTLSTKERNEQEATLLDEMNGETDVYYQYITILLIVHTLSIAYLFQNFQELIYSRLRGVYTRFINLSLILNATSTVIVFYWLYKYLFEYTTNLSGVENERKVKTIIDRQSTDSEFDLELAVAVLTSIQYARMIFALQMSRIFGPMVKILGNMLIDLMTFIFMYLLVFLIFTCASQLLFSKVDGYSDLVSWAITLFSASLGDFDYGVFETAGLSTKNKYMGEIFLTVYLIISTITLLNFLIAILSNTYDFLQNHKNALYLREVVLLRQKYRYEAKLSSIVSAFVPLNIFALIMDPFLIMCKSKKLNKICLLFEYIAIALISVALQIIISLIILPFSYIIVWVNKIKFWFRKPFFGKYDILLRILDMIMFIFIGLVWLLIMLGWDTIKYVYNLFDKNVKLIQDNDDAKIAHNNALKDGSIDYEKFWEMHNEESIGNDNSAKIRSSIQGSTVSGNVGNPVREGLCDTSLKLLKITLKMMKDDYLKFIKNEHCTMLMIPVETIIKEMYKNMCIQEHINKVCLGVYYQKDDSFFKTTTFIRILEGFRQYDSEDVRGKDQNQDYSGRGSLKLADLFARRFDIKSLFWKNKLQNFILKSDEKWILDQYNLIKRFCIDNSIAAFPTETNFFKVREEQHKKKLNSFMPNIDLVKSSTRSSKSKSGDEG
jgi:hypothetical protein